MLRQKTQRQLCLLWGRPKMLPAVPQCHDLLFVDPGLRRWRLSEAHTDPALGVQTAGTLERNETGSATKAPGCARSNYRGRYWLMRVAAVCRSVRLPGRRIDG